MAGLSRRISGLMNRFYLWVRHPDAFRAAGESGTATDFSALRCHGYCLLLAFRRTGEPVPTPVWFGLDSDGRLYVRSESYVGKVKRIRNDPHVRVGPCISGTGEAVGIDTVYLEIVATGTG